MSAEPKIADLDDPFGISCTREQFVEVNEVLSTIDSLKNVYNIQSTSEKAYERFSFVLTQYIEQPHLLDPHLDEILMTLIEVIRNPENNLELKHYAFKYLFTIVNVRGYKVVVRHLPHEVSDFERVLRMLEAQNVSDSDTWATRYILLLWLSIIIVIPFDLHRFDGSKVVSSDSNQSIMGRVFRIIQTYVVVPDKCRDAAAYLSAFFITRSDVKDHYLVPYINWIISTDLSNESNVFINYGILLSVGKVLKHGKRDLLLPHAQRILQWLVNANITTKCGNTIQKLLYKVTQRIGLIFLPPRVATWRYQRGRRSLAINLCGGDSVASPVDQLNASELGINDNVDVPDEVEEVIDQLIQGLCSDAGVARWSAAKGIGRVTGRLPQQLADEVVISVLELFTPRQGDGAWHGGCLALAELGRRGLLLPERLPEVIPLITKALVYDEPRGYSSVGSHVRDAACYVCWSFARAYEPEILAPFVIQIAATILTVACFDREINCRRAASAAFQENVGRQGIFPHGIEILNVADFFGVSIRNNSYLVVSEFIAQYGEYANLLIDHLLVRKVTHWDTVIRQLTAKALHNLSTKSVDYIVQRTLPDLFQKAIGTDLNSRHGAVLAIGEILYALSKQDQIEDMIGDDLVRATTMVIPQVQAKSYLRGMGGELMREACCHFIENCCLAAFELTDGPVTGDWLLLLNESICHNVINIREAAIHALPCLLSQYYKSPASENNTTELVEKYLFGVRNVTSQESRMGHALALGALPRFLLKQHLSNILEGLIFCTRITSETFTWAESRRDAVNGLITLVTTLTEDIGCKLTNENILDIYTVLLEGLKDYTQDKRGDIGAWNREACLNGLYTITVLVFKQNPNILSADLLTSVMNGMLQQAVEKIDRTRALAGTRFCKILSNEPPIISIPHYERITAIFQDANEINWYSGADTFPRFIQLLQFPIYTYSLLLGLITSVGGITETLVRNSLEAFTMYLQQQDVNEVRRICDVSCDIFTNCQKNDRILVPMLRFVDRVFGTGCINSVVDDENNEFSTKTVKLIIAELNGCRDVHKLVAGLNALCQFVQVNKTCKSALTQLSMLLCHKQPYIRRTTATSLYQVLLIDGDSCDINSENLEEIMQILSTTSWEKPLEHVRPIRNQLCQLLEIRTPVIKSKT